MPASLHSMAVQKKHSVIPPSQGPLSTRLIDSQRKTNRSDKKENGGNSTPTSQNKKTPISLKKFGENVNCGPQIAAGTGTNYDERLKAVRERREERQNLIASRELDRLNREQRARHYYEQQLQERKKKLLEQRQMEEKRRSAVEEKRQRRLKEEKERHESTVRKTHEKSQRAIKQINDNARGRKINKNAPRRLPLTTWEKNLVSRLLTPTYSFLARCKSAGFQSGQEVSFHSMNTPTTTPSHQKAQQRPAPVYQRPPAPVYQRPPAPPSVNSRQQRVNSPSQIRSPRQQDGVKIHTKNNLNSRQTAVKAATIKQRAPPPSSPPLYPPPSLPQQRPARRSGRRRSSPLLLDLPPVPEEDVNICSSALSPGNSRPVRTTGDGYIQENPSRAHPPNCSDAEKSSSQGGSRGFSEAFLHSAQPTEVSSQSAPENGNRLLAEKKRQAQLQREKDEIERREQDEAERQKQQQLERRRAEEKTQALLQEKRRREEEEQRRAEEERAQAMREAALLQKRREEEQAKAEQIKQEQQSLAQKAEAERQARKKRLDEIMRRTRRTDSPDTSSVLARTLPKDVQPNENTEHVKMEKIEDAVRITGGTRTAQRGLNNEAEMVPAVAFKERSSLRMLSGLEEIQAQQRAEVI